MILGIGTDIVAYARIEALYEKYGENFAKRVLSASEMSELATHANPARLLMKRFAAKEALAKATGSGMRFPVSLLQISIAHDTMGKPIFEFGDELLAYMNKLGVSRHHLSISDERDVAVAFVILEGGD